MDATGWTILCGSTVYLLGVLGAIQVLSEFLCGRKGLEIFLQCSLGAILWPAVMPIIGLTWLFGVKYWTKE